MRHAQVLNAVPLAILPPALAASNAGDKIAGSTSFACALFFSLGMVYAQGRGGPPPVPKTAREAAPVDLTGYWVSVVTEDWRWRMVTPIRGDFASVPLQPGWPQVG